jgi:phospholipid/cholesterol/gamma-HCH transport system ATP-binding protein
MKKFKEQGISGILVTHDIPTALRICDRILILKDGVINFNGTTEEFENSNDSFVKTFLKYE